MKGEVTPNQTLLYKASLMEQLNPEHELLRLAELLDWNGLDAKFGRSFTIQRGRPGVPTRAVLGLLLLKYLYDESDESVCDRFVENPYWQKFCGYSEFQHEPPCVPTALVKWRKRMGAELEFLLKETLEAAKRSGALKQKMLQDVIVDTTVQEKAVTHPSDARLLVAMQRRLIRKAKREGLPLRRTWMKAAKLALIHHGRLRHAGQHRRAKRQLRRMRTCLRRVMRMMSADFSQLNETLGGELQLAQRVLDQARGKVPSSERIYSLHAPEVECIAKGKAHKKYEFGCKVALATTSGKHPFILASDAVHGNPYDGATLKGTVAQMERVTGVKPAWVGADLGYRGKIHWPEGVGVIISRTRHLGGKLKRFMRRRSAIEPVIGHAKRSHKMDRNHLNGRMGDRINAMLSASAWNLMQVWRHLARQGRLFLRLLAFLIKLRLPGPDNPLDALRVAA